MSVLKQLDLRQVESFIPTSEAEHVWKNRQRVKITFPVIPSYVFVRANREERTKVLEAPGVLWIVGNNSGPIPLRDPEIDFLRSDFCRGRLEPWPELAVGRRARIREGLMAGLEGVLTMKKSNLRFVLSVEMINQNVAVEVDAGDVEPLN